MSNKQLGTLFLVATPIGNLEEVSPRTIKVLKQSAIIASEDTRNTRKLLSHFDIHNKLVAYHNFNEKKEVDELIKYLQNGQDVALTSDAGYPLISDPGYVLVNEVINIGAKIVTISGANAAINALVASGLNTNHYLFYGFLNAKISQARKELEDLKVFPYTIIFYEAPHRINKTLSLMKEILGDRNCCIARELTKVHEEYLRGKFSDLENKEIIGEIVLIVEGNKQEKEEVSFSLALNEVKELILKGLKTKDACKEISEKYHLSKNDLYNAYLKNHD